MPMLLEEGNSGCKPGQGPPRELEARKWIADHSLERLSKAAPHALRLSLRQCPKHFLHFQAARLLVCSPLDGRPGFPSAICIGDPAT